MSARTPVTPDDGPVIVRASLLNLQVCVPADFTDAQAEEFANAEMPTGISSCWSIADDIEPKRADCCDRAGYVHMVLTC